MRATLAVLSSLAVVIPTFAKADDPPLRDPHSMYRHVGIVPDAPEARPGHITFRAQLDLWTGASVKPGWPAYLDSCHLRVEVYDPKDTTFETPIFVKETVPVLTPIGLGEFEHQPVYDFDLGPFQPSNRPFTVRVHLMKGGTKGQKPDPNAFGQRISNTFSGTEFKAVVR